jgi:nicotinamidase-related amidase
MQPLSLDALRSFSGVGAVDVDSPATALLLVDMQVDCIRPHGYTLQRLRARGLEEAARQYERQCRIAIPNLARLLERFRRAGQTVAHTHVVKRPGRQPGGLDGPVRAMVADGAEFIEELAPEPGELVVAKTCSGVFAGTNLDYLLRRLGITGLVVGGVVTNGCVEHAITHGHDLGYACVLVSDGSAALTDEIHENALERLAHRRAHVVSASAILRGGMVAQAAAPTRAPR